MVTGTGRGPSLTPEYGMSETSRDTVKKVLRDIYREPEKRKGSTLVDKALERNREAANAPNPLRQPRTDQ